MSAVLKIVPEDRNALNHYGVFAQRFNPEGDWEFFPARNLREAMTISPARYVRTATEREVKMLAVKSLIR